MDAMGDEHEHNTPKRSPPHGGSWFAWLDKLLPKDKDVGAQEYADTDGDHESKLAQVVDFVKTTYQAFLLHWPSPGVRFGRALEWRSDEEFGRAVSPTTMSLLNSFKASLAFPTRESTQVYATLGLSLLLCHLDLVLAIWSCFC